MMLPAPHAPALEPSLPPGLRTVPTGPRIGARLLDSVLGTLALLGCAWAALELWNGRITPLGIIGVIIFLVWGVFALWALFGRGARLGGLLLGQRWVTVGTWQRSSWAVLAKLLLQNLFTGITLGIGEPIISLVSFRPPHHRNWFDRVAGLVLVSGVRGPDTPPPPPPPPSGNVHQVGMPDHRVAPAGPTPSSATAPPVLTAPAERPIRDVGVRQVNEQFIESTPWSGERVAQPVSHPEPPRRPAVIRQRTNDPRAEVPAAPTDHTVYAPHADLGPAPWLRLDDGTRIDLDTTVVFGREPVAPPDLRGAVPQAVQDPTMRLSKTHLAVGIDPAGVWVLDLYSTNGVRVDRPGTGPDPLTPGQVQPVPAGSRIEFGGRWLEVRHG